MAAGIPTLSEFNPKTIPFQWRLVQDVSWELDYSKGVHEILCSGSVGSAKTLVCAHLAVMHCLLNPFATVGIGRLTMPSLKDTLLNVILQHISGELEYNHNKTTGQIRFSNGSKIVPFSWKDRNYRKFRSYELTAVVVDELTENMEPDFYHELRMRVGRVKHVEPKFILCATNPDSPSHWVYEHFFETNDPMRHVYYSKTIDNPYLDETYIRSLEESLDPKLARRMLHGEWIELMQDCIYYAYDKAYNYVDSKYEVNNRYPIHWSWDFNIGDNKPMSSVFIQRDASGVFHCFDEVVIDSARTEDVLEDAHARGLLDLGSKIIVNGDATGRHRSTNSKRSDYGIIEHFLSNNRRSDGRVIPWELSVGRSNPPIRTRHNKVNAMLCNSVGHRKIKVYSPCATLDKGLRLTQLKSGGQYIEDDSKPWQHITTSLGYSICDAEHYYKRQRPAEILSR